MSSRTAGSRLERAIQVNGVDGWETGHGGHIAMFNAEVMEQASRDRVYALLGRDDFRAWFVSPEVPVLVIDMRCVDPRPGWYISLQLGAVLYQLREEIKPEIAGILYMEVSCDRHTREWNPFGGPRGLVRSLIGQLLVQYRHFSNQVLDRVAAQREEYNFAAMMSILNELLQELPRRTTVFVIIDSISSMREAREGDRDFIAYMLTTTAILHMRPNLATLRVVFVGPRRHYSLILMACIILSLEEACQSRVVGQPGLWEMI